MGPIRDGLPVHPEGRSGSAMRSIVQLSHAREVYFTGRRALSTDALRGIRLRSIATELGIEKDRGPNRPMTRRISKPGSDDASHESPLRRDAKVVHDERIHVRRLLQLLRRAAGAVTRLRIDANKYGIDTRLCRLQSCRVLERMRRDDTVIMISSRHKNRWILRAWLHIMNRRVSIQRFELPLRSRRCARSPRPSSNRL